jgi:MarR family transcriptional regulator, organic hydroperoxide resistance regulator
VITQFDYARSKGGAALGARLRRLSERIDREVAQIYAERGIQFEQRWYGVLNQIVLREPIAVTDVASALRISHVSVSQASSSLERAGLIVIVADPGDGRRRLLTLSVAGRKLVDELRPLWKTLDAVAERLNAEAGDVVTLLDRLDDSLAASSFGDRVRAAELVRLKKV